MHRRTGILRTVVVVAASVAALAFVAGCTTESTPVGINTSGAPQGVAIATAPELVNYSPAQTQQLLDSGLNASYAVINAKRGGKITNGAFTLSIPANALSQDTQISLAPASAYQMACQVEPTGLQLRSGYAATLSFNWKGTDAEGVSTANINARWFDPSTSTWVRIDGANAPQKQTRYDASLSHFSYYALAK